MDVKYNRKLSWEKQSVFDSPDFSFTLEFSPHYGEMISRVDFAGGYWHASSGFAAIPENLAFLREWIETHPNPAIQILSSKHLQKFY
jgi:hypothetical protein